MHYVQRSNHLHAEEHEKVSHLFSQCSLDFVMTVINKKMKKNRLGNCCLLGYAEFGFIFFSFQAFSLLRRFQVLLPLVSALPFSLRFPWLFPLWVSAAG